MACPHTDCGESVSDLSSICSDCDAITGRSNTQLTLRDQTELTETSSDIKPVETENINKNYLPLTELVSENSAMFDDRGLYLRVCSREVITSKHEFHDELCSKQKDCILLFSQKMHENILKSTDKRVRFLSNLDSSAIKEFCTSLEMSDDLKSYLYELSKVGYKILENSGVFGHLIQLDIKQDVKIQQGGESHRVRVKTDLITCHDHDPQQQCNGSGDKHLTSDDCMQSDDKGDNSIDSKFNLQEGFSANNRGSQDDSHDNNKEMSSDLSEKQTSQKKIKEGQVSKQNSNAVSFIITLRQSIPALSIFNLYLTKMLHEHLSTYILVCHVGPLVENEIVLYEYRSRTFGFNLEGADINKAMKNWCRQEGKLVFPVTPIQDFVKHTIYEYQGLKKKTKEKKDKKVIKIYLE